MEKPKKVGFVRRQRKSPPPAFAGAGSSFCSPNWTRTSNRSINSRMLCQLSYGGLLWPSFGAESASLEPRTDSSACRRPTTKRQVSDETAVAVRSDAPHCESCLGCRPITSMLPGHEHHRTGAAPLSRRRAAAPRRSTPPEPRPSTASGSAPQQAAAAERPCGNLLPRAGCPHGELAQSVRAADS